MPTRCGCAGNLYKKLGNPTMVAGVFPSLCFLTYVIIFTISVWNIVTSTFVEKEYQRCQGCRRSRTFVPSDEGDDVISFEQIRAAAEQPRFRQDLTVRGVDIKNDAWLRLVRLVGHCRNLFQDAQCGERGRGEAFNPGDRLCADEGGGHEHRSAVRELRDPNDLQCYGKEEQDSYLLSIQQLLLDRMQDVELPSPGWSVDEPLPLGARRERKGGALSEHPGVVVTSLTRSERIVVPGAKEAFAVVTFKEAKGVGEHGGQPCVHCGEWTGCFCEGCPDIPAAISTRCDQERLLCHTCVRAGRLYADVARQDTAGFLEVTGFNDEHGNFARFEEPLRSSWPSSNKEPDPGDVMAPDLIRVLRELPTDVLDAVRQLGATTVGDFHHLRPSSQACYEELEKRIRRRLDTNEAMKIAVAWTNARRASLQAIESLGLAVAKERRSSVGGPSRVVSMDANPVPPPSAPVSNKVRRLTPSGLRAPLTAPLVTHVAQLDPHVREDAAKQAKLDQLFALVVEHIVDLGELQMTPAKLADAMERQKFKDALMAGASRLSGPRIGALSSALKRWLRVCEARGHDAQSPAPLVLAEFLREISAGGPTAASSMHASLRWFATNLGAHFPLDHWAVKHFRFHAVHHTGKQAAELEPWQFINLAILMSRVQGSHKLIVSFLLMVAVGCVRFEHVQRSRLVRCHGAWIEFDCAQGKSRKQGARPGYRWGLPQVTMHGHHMTKVIMEFFNHEFPKDHSFLIPAVELNPEELWEITESTAFIANKAMSRGRFLELMRGALVQVGVDFSQAQSSTYNKLRRFLPTMANVMELGDLDLQAVGNWTDLPSGGGRDPSARKPRGVMPMGVHYAGSRTLRSLQVKQRCVDRLMALYHHKRQELAMTEDGFLCRDGWLWPVVAALHQTFPEDLTPLAQTSSLGDIEVAPGALAEVEARVPPSAEPPAQEAMPSASDAVEVSGSDSSLDTSSSASDESADGHDLVGVLADDSAPEELSWIRQGRKTHLIREEVDGRPVPWCRDFAFPQDPAARGRGFTVTSRSDFCQRCLGRVSTRPLSGPG
eukprot:s71_g16.t1